MRRPAKSKMKAVVNSLAKTRGEMLIVISSMVF